MKKESVGYVVAFTFIVCVVFVLGLSVVNFVTVKQVEANRSYAAHVAVLKAFGLADEATARDTVESDFAQKITVVPGDTVAYKAEIDGTPYVAVRFVGPGLWGSITAIVAADANGTRIRGLEILDQQETPGLGGRIDEKWFKDQFRGEKVGAGGSIKVDTNGTGTGDTDKENSRVDAISGASRTSDFIRQIVDGAIAVIVRTGGAL